ncbi:MAG: hypothetical protein ACRCX8_06650 [Sarcina sp.]
MNGYQKTKSKIIKKLSRKTGWSYSEIKGVMFNHEDKDIIIKRVRQRLGEAEAMKLTKLYKVI